ncbi:MAG: glycine cleavage system protein GcvH [Candidatus Neomarinimicrobiota bacterium]
MNTPDSLLYTKNHEWVLIEDNVATVGITDFAQGELGDIIYLELPDSGATVVKDDPFGTIEAVKTVADLFAPVPGTIVEVNESLDKSPEKVNKEPYGEGWIIKIEMSDPSELENLMNADEYDKIIQ